MSEHGHVARDQDRSRVGAGAQTGDLGRVVAPVGRAVERIGDEGETIERRQGAFFPLAANRRPIGAIGHPVRRRGAGARLKG